MELTLENADIQADEIRGGVWSDGLFPVDPIQICRALGIRVAEMDLPGDVDGALLKKVNEDPIIMLHKNDVSSRKRFTCAHELGHFISRKANGDYRAQEIDIVDLRNGVSSTGKKEDER